MAALEKIRKKAVFLTIVIGVALLAFILGDAEKMVSTVFGNNNTIAKVDGDKIDAVEFQKRYEEASQKLQNQGQTVDAAVLQQQVIEQMISELLLNKELENVGIDVSDAEITEAMTGKNANMLVLQFAQQMGVESPAQLYDLLYNPTKYGANDQQVAEAKAQWEKIQDEVVKNLKYSKLQSLIAGSIQANKLDRKQINSENAITNTIQYVKTAYDAITGDQYKPTDAELKAQYDKDKYMYKLDEEVRKIHYVAVDVVPSKADLNKSAAMIGETLDSLRMENGVDRVRNNSELVINEGTVRLSDIRDTEVKDFVASAAVGQVSEPRFTNSTSTYNIIKLVKKDFAVDSVNVNVVSVQGAKSLQDSVLNMLNAGVSLSDVKKKVKTADGQENQWQVIMNVTDSVKTKLTNAPAGYFKLDGNDKAAFFCKVNEKKAPKAMYTVAQIEHKVYPSTETTNNLRDKLQNFIMKNNTASTFEANAAKAGYQAVETTVSPSTAQIDRIENTRKAIQWVFGASKDNVSPIFDKDNNTKMVVVALDAVYDDYAPLTDEQVKAAVTIKASNEKKADALMKKLEGKKSLAEFASAMSTSIDTTQVTFGQAFIPKIGVGESELTAKVSVAKKGAVVGPVKGVNGVYAFEVTKVDKSERTPTDIEADRTFATTRGNQAVMQNAIEILRKAVKVKKDMLKFF